MLEVTSLAPRLLSPLWLDLLYKVVVGELEGYAEVYQGELWSPECVALLVWVPTSIVVSLAELETCRWLCEAS